MLAGARLNIVAEDVGGVSGRKLVFRTDTGATIVTTTTKGIQSSTTPLLGYQ